MGCLTIIVACMCSFIVLWLFESINGAVWLILGLMGLLFAIIYFTASRSDSRNYSSPQSSSSVKHENRKSMEQSDYSPIIEYGNYKVKKISPKKLEIIGYTGIDEPCLVIPAEFEGIPVSSIGANVFCNCMYVEKVLIPEGICEIHDGAFNGCKKLNEVNLPSTLKYLGKEVFQECALQSVTVPPLVTSLEDRSFCNCTHLKQVKVSDNITFIGESCFSGTALQTFQFPKHLKIIGRRAFLRTKLVEVIIPGSVREMGLSAFYGCRYLTRVIIQEGLKKIDAEAFSNCEALREVTIPKSIVSIEDDSFGKKYYKNGDIYNLVVEPLDIVMYCYEGSYGLQYARQHKFKYKNAMER